MSVARSAIGEDIGELVRLRGVMLAAMAGREVSPGPWQAAAATTLRERLADGSLAAFVVPHPERPAELVSCAVGVIERRLAGPGNPSGLVGHISNVATDRAYRRRGYSRSCLEALLGWYRLRGVTKVDLHATPDGEPLYRSLGFAHTATPAMRLRRG